MHNNKLSFWCRFIVVHKYNKYDIYIYIWFSQQSVLIMKSKISMKFLLWIINLWMTRFNFSSLTCITLRVYESVCVLQVQGRGLEYFAHFKERLSLFFFFLKLIEPLNTRYDQSWNFSFSHNHSKVRFSVNIELNYCGQSKSSFRIRIEDV